MEKYVTSKRLEKIVLLVDWRKYNATSYTFATMATSRPKIVRVQKEKCGVCQAKEIVCRSEKGKDWIFSPKLVFFLFS